MKTKRISDRAAAEVDLARRLERCASITRYDNDEHKEAWALAHALYDLEVSSRTIQDLVAKLRQGDISDDAIKDILLDIGEELRQVVWHVDHLKFYHYLPRVDQA